MELITIIGPTACGKTGRAVQLARHIGAEIISGDSRQVYRGMDLGTGKDLEEYGEIPYHLIDIVDAGEKYNLHRFLKDFRSVCADLERRECNAVFCGGSGMYVETALSGIALPEVERNDVLRKSLEGKSLQELTQLLAAKKRLHNTTDVDTPARAIRALEIAEYYESHPEETAMSDKKNATPVVSLIIGIDIPRDARRQRISKRLDARLKAGMVKEVERLIAEGVSVDALIYYGLEYKYLTLFVLGKISYQEMHDSLEIAIHQFSKRQMTWWRGMERRGFKINWLPYDMTESEFLRAVDRLR